MVMEKAKRLVEYGTRRRDLPRLHHPARPGLQRGSARTAARSFPAGIDATALHPKPKRFFGTARNDRRRREFDDHRHRAGRHRQSKMDDVIFEEFKGTGNMELHLDRRLVDKRVWPAIDVNRSGTRREELLMDPEELRRVWILRRVLNDMNPVEAMELLTGRMRKTKTNAEFLMSMNLS